MATLTPDDAAKSIAARVKTIAQCEEYIRATMARYEGLKSLQILLTEAGVASKVSQIVAKE